MHIRFAYKTVPACAIIYAWPQSESLQVPFKKDAAGLTCYKFWHNVGEPSLTLHREPTHCINDYYVDFESNVPHDEWRRQVERSEYNMGYRFNILTHNCANAATFALWAADIQVTYNPRFYATPESLYHAVKTHKLMQLKFFLPKHSYLDIQNHIKHGVEHESKSRTPDMKSASIVKKIALEIDKFHVKHPEHIEFQVHTLMKTWNIFLNSNYDSVLKKELDEYLKLSKRFENRVVVTSNFDNLEKIRLLTATIMMFIFIDIMQNLLGQKSVLPLALDAFLLIPSAITLFQSPRSLTRIGFVYKDMCIKPTELSRTMNELVQHKKESTPPELELLITRKNQYIRR